MYIEELVYGTNLENTKTEFKQRILTGKDKQGFDEEIKWLKEIVAFSNSGGGKIYVGVDDKTHEVHPLDHTEVDKEARLVYEKIEERVSPSITPELKEIPVPGFLPTKYVLCIAVTPSKQLPVYLHIEGIPACFIREFGRTTAASPEQITELVIKNEDLSYDSYFTDEKIVITDFSTLSMAYSKENPGKEINQRLFESIGFCNSSGNLSRGALLFKDDYKDNLTLVKCTKYPGITRGTDVVSASENYQGNILNVINKAFDFVVSHSNNGYIKTPDSRKNYQSFPSRSLFEGIVNAYAHRNYFISGSQVMIDVFDDRLEITSPGSLLGNKELHDDKDIVSINPRRRNNVICNGLVLANYMEAKGSGFEKISDEYSGYGESFKPYVSSDSDSFTLVLPDLTFEGGVVGKDNPNPSIVLPIGLDGPYDEKILSHCYTKSRSLIDIASYLNLVPSTYLREKVLDPLVAKSFLHSSREGKKIFYQTNRNKVNLKS